MSTSSFATYRLVRALRLQKEELGDDQGGHLVIHGAVHEHDSLLQQPGVQVESPLSAVGALQDHGDHIEGAGLLLRGLGDAAQAARQQLLRQLAQVSAHRLQTLFPARCRRRRRGPPAKRSDSIPEIFWMWKEEILLLSCLGLWR